MTFCVDVITADSSKLKNRGLAYAFTSSPYMITAFAGPKAAESFLEHINWRWGFGCFAIIFPVVASPLYFVLKFNLRKAEKEGVLATEKSGRTLIQSIWHYAIEFDCEFETSDSRKQNADLVFSTRSRRSVPLLGRPHCFPPSVYACC